METDAQGGVRKLVDEDPAADKVGTDGTARQLQHTPVVVDGVVVLDLTPVLAGEHEPQVEASQRHERGVGLGRRDGEATIEVGNEVVVQVLIGGGVRADLRDAELLRQASLHGAEGALAAAPRFGRAGEDVPDAERRQRAAHLPMLLGIGGGAGDAGAPEMTAAVGVELGEAAMARQYGVEAGERRRRALLRHEARIQDPPVGIIERHDQVLHRHPVIQRCVDASRCTSMPIIGRRSRLRRYLPRAGAFGASPAACSTSRVHVYDSVKPCCSVARSQKWRIEKSGYCRRLSAQSARIVANGIRRRRGRTPR